MKIVAELALVHDGSLGNALALIDACAAAGVDAVKMQCRDGDPCREFRPGTYFPQDNDRQSYWKRTAFTTAQWAMLSQWTHSHGLQFGLSAFNTVAVHRLGRLVDFWKVGSGSVGNIPLVGSMGSSCGNVVISTGMCDLLELQSAVLVSRNASGNPPTMLHCTSEYPTPAESFAWNVMEETQGLARQWDCHWGLSDHSGSIAPGIAACALGADMLEVHVCFDKRQFGPDVAASLTIDQLAELVRGVRYIETAMANPVDRDQRAAAMEPLRKLFEGQESGVV